MGKDVLLPARPRQVNVGAHLAIAKSRWQSGADDAHSA
jgi:hypothetical protein